MRIHHGCDDISKSKASSSSRQLLRVYFPNTAGIGVQLVCVYGALIGKVRNLIKRGKNRLCFDFASLLSGFWPLVHMFFNCGMSWGRTIAANHAAPLPLRHSGHAANFARKDSL